MAGDFESYPGVFHRWLASEWHVTHWSAFAKMSRELSSLLICGYVPMNEELSLSGIYLCIELLEVWVVGQLFILCPTFLYLLDHYQPATLQSSVVKIFCPLLPSSLPPSPPPLRIMVRESPIRDFVSFIAASYWRAQLARICFVTWRQWPMRTQS